MKVKKNPSYFPPAPLVSGLQSHAHLQSQAKKRRQKVNILRDHYCITLLNIDTYQWCTMPVLRMYET